ncbi:hypothetical protein H9P43_008498 [Blastocladiella emersonii ATCC 22665]|nr:hypothetical protein H9P43_008498 [Blastocladiella emersonii ATCC 22665]
MEPKCKLELHDILERVLVHAIQLRPDPNDLAGLLAYAHVIRPSRATHRALLRRCPCLGLDTASARGAVRVLNAWREFGLFDATTAPVATAVAAAAEARHLAVLEWWRDLGAPLEEAAAHRPDQVAVALGLGRPVYCDHGNGFRQWIDFAPPPEPDAGIYAALNAITVGSCTELVLNHERLSLNGIRTLSVALASPDQRLTSLTIRGSTLDLPRLRALRLPATVTVVALQQCWFPPSTRSTDPFSGWPPHLAVLHLDCNPLSPTLATVLFSCLPATLRRVSLSECQIDDATLCTLAPLLPRGLVALSLPRNEVRNEGLGAACLYLPPPLSRLDLAGNVIGSVPAASAVHWSLPPNLRELVLDHTVLDQLGTRALASSVPRSLETLRVRDAHMVSSEIPALAAALPPTLRELDFGCNRVAEHAVAALAAGLPPGLEALALDRCRIHAHLMAHDVAPHLPRGLRRLDLSRTELGDAGALAFAAHVPPGIEMVYLAHVDVGDEGVAALASAMPRSLVALSLAGNPRVTDAGARAVAANWPPRLVELILAGTSVSADAVAAIQAAADAASKRGEDDEDDDE